MNRLSHSSIKLYSECGQKWKYHYKDRLREKTRSGALCFGTAFDKATEAVAKDLTINEKDVFDASFINQDINGEMVYIPDSTLLVYANSDFDFDLLSDEDKRFLQVKAGELKLKGDLLEIYERCKTSKAQRFHKPFKESENKFYNLCNWLSLRRKGHLMLEANRTKVLPFITKVIGTQVEIKLENDEKDSIIGFADLVGRWKGIDEDIVLDYKTSARAYPLDAVITSSQLAIYANALGLKKGGFLVFKKQVLKNRTKICSICGHIGTGSKAKTCDDYPRQIEGRCGGKWIEKIRPEIDVQILIDDIPIQTTESVMENAQAANEGIKAGIFTKNLSNCQQPWGRCGYFDLCHKGIDSGNLVELPEKPLDKPVGK